MDNPFDTQQPSLMTRFWRKFVLGVLILCLACATVLTGNGIVRAHENGQPFWMSDPFYKMKEPNPYNWNCCGPEDCLPAETLGSIITEDDGGFWVRDSRAQEHVYFSKTKDFKRGLYFTEDEKNRAFVCVHNGKIVCLAVPRKAGI